MIYPIIRRSRVHCMHLYLNIVETYTCMHSVHSIYSRAVRGIVTSVY